MAAASRVAVRHLVSRGLRSKVHELAGTPELARRVVAALAIPISRRDAILLKNTICAPEQGPSYDPTHSREQTRRHT